MERFWRKENECGSSSSCRGPERMLRELVLGTLIILVKQDHCDDWKSRTFWNITENVIWKNFQVMTVLNKIAYISCNCILPSLGVVCSSAGPPKGKKEHTIGCLIWGIVLMGSITQDFEVFSPQRQEEWSIVQPGSYGYPIQKEIRDKEETSGETPADSGPIGHMCTLEIRKHWCCIGPWWQIWWSWR